MLKPAIAALVLFTAPALHAQWTYVASGTTAELRGIGASAHGHSVWWTSGQRGTVLRSTDGGRSWIADTVPGAAHLDFRSIAAVDDRTAFVASAGEAEKGLAKIYVTRDAGRTWALSFSTEETGVFFDAIAFFGHDRGVVVSDPVGGRFLVLVTNDGGRTWKRPPAEQLPATLPGEAAFAASGSSLIIHADAQTWLGTGGGGKARVFHSGGGGWDWGRHWWMAETPVHADGPAAGIFSLATLDGKHLVAVGGDYTKPTLAATSVALSDDMGRTWRAAKAPPAAYLSGVAYAGDGQRLVAVGLAGTFVSRDGGEHWTQADTIALNAVRFLGRRGVAVGPRGRVAFMDSLP